MDCPCSFSLCSVGVMRSFCSINNMLCMVTSLVNQTCSFQLTAFFDDTLLSLLVRS